MRWNHQTILDEIRYLHSTGEELCFSHVESSHPHVVRAALWHFGSWKRAVEVAGFDPQLTSKYRRWTRDRVVEAIRAHHREGHDLSWRAVSTCVDPPLAAAARRTGVGFDSWEQALQAAGVNPQKVVKYRRWTRESVLEELRLLKLQPRDFSATAMQRDHQSLYSAATRRFESWAEALQAAGIDARHNLRPVAKRRAQTAREAAQTSNLALCAASFLPAEPDRGSDHKPDRESECEPDAESFKSSSQFDAHELSARTIRMAARITAKRDRLSDERDGSRELKSRD